VAPAATGSAAALTQVRTGALLLVAPQSAAARLLALGLQLDFANGILEYLIPYVGTRPQPIFAGEGAPIAVSQAVTGRAVVGPMRKIASIFGLSNELEQATPEAASVVIGRLVSEALALSLDFHVFDSNPADVTRPAGLLWGVTPLTASPLLGTAIDTASVDVCSLAGAIAGSMIDTSDMVLVCHPVQATKLRLTRGYEDIGVTVLSTPMIAKATVIACIPAAIASGVEAVEIEVSEHPTLVFDDSALELVNSAGIPGAPAESMFQTNSLAVKLRLRLAFGSVQPGCIQYMVNVNW
jgi:hypothetical protein